jgi:colicin import membrane protein
LQGASEPEEGLATGSIHGTANTQTEGDPYASMIRDMIRDHWNVPQGLSMGDVLNLEATIRIRLAEDGTMLDPKVVKSSGNALYDDTCVQAIQATRKVPPPPAEKRAVYRRGILFPFDGKSLAH